MAKKYYAVKVGLVPGIYEDWDSCKEVVNKCPGAKYKSFKTRHEAEEYLGVNKSDKENNQKDNEIYKEISKERSKEGYKKGDKKALLKPNSPALDLNRLIAYVDGSYKNDVGKYSYGIVILTPEGRQKEFTGCDNKQDVAEIRNVAGEILGVMYAVKWAIHNNYSQIEIRYDYQGIENWATGKWKTKNPFTIKYKDYMQKCMEKIEITFVKVKAHSNEKYNELADSLAKQALEMPNHTPF